MKSHLHSLYRRMQIWVDVWWYPILAGILTFIDVFVIFVPSDGILVSSVLLRPKKWWIFAMAMALGSVLGGTVFALLISHYGLALLESLMPAVLQSTAWSLTEVFFQRYGLIVLFLAAASPLSFQPAMFFSIVAQEPLLIILLVLLFGRLIKNFGISIVAAKAPAYLSKIWGLRSDLEEIGISQASKK